MTLFKNVDLDGSQYEQLKLKLNVVPILSLIKDTTEKEVLNLLHVEMLEKKRMDHCHRLYRRYRFLVNRRLDSKFMDDCKGNRIKIPEYVLKSNGIKTK